jgi:hypothetical protein
MSRPRARTQQRVATTHVWFGLSSDQQQRAVRLLAQLAYAQVRAHAPLPAKENNHGRVPSYYQDSSRPS